MKLIIEAISDKGLVRATNEDMILVGNDCLRDAAKSYAFDFSTYEHPFLIAVADGLGGHKAGAYASGFVLKKMAEAVSHLPMDLKRPTLKSYFTATAKTIHQFLLEEGEADLDKKGMASTFSGLLFYGKKVFYMHIGDSRIYHYSAGNLKRLSRDHSLQVMKGNNGALKTAIVNTFGGVKDMFLDFEEISQKMQNDDILFVCSDGLTGELSDEEIAVLVTQTDAQQKLVEAAKQHGGNDNISIGMIRYIKYWE